MASPHTYSEAGRFLKALLAEEMQLEDAVEAQIRLGPDALYAVTDVAIRAIHWLAQESDIDPGALVTELVEQATLALLDEALDTMPGETER